MKKYLYPAYALLCMMAGTASAQQGVSAPGNSVQQRAWQGSARPAIDYRQGATTAANGKGSHVKVERPEVTENFTTYEQVRKHASSEAVAANKGYEQDAELGILYANAPCSDCYEVLDKRSATQKYFVKEGTGGTSFIQQSGSEPVHYKDVSGKWRTISNNLVESRTLPGVYSTTGRQLEVTVNTNEGYLTMTTANGTLTYNRNLQLVYVKPDGTETMLGAASWSHRSVGSSGMMVTNVWPGIDMYLYVVNNSVKTNFVMNHALPAYAAGKLVIRDHMAAGQGLSFAQADKQAFAGTVNIVNAQGEPMYQVQKANAYEQDNKAASMQDLNYKVNDQHVVDLEIPGALCNKAGAAYPVVIDPLVTGVTGPNGFVYSFGSSYCTTNNNVTIPPAATITDVTISYGYRAVSGTNESEVDARFQIHNQCETIRFHCPTWHGTGLGTGGSQCLMSGFSFWGTSGLDAEWGTTSLCTPAFSCSAYTLSFQLLTAQSHSSTSGCVQTVVETATPFTVNVYGTGGATISPATASTYCTGTVHTYTGGPTTGGSWSSSNPAVAAVSTTGDVTSVAVGTATITYTMPGCSGVYATSTVTNVAPPTVAPVTGGAAAICEFATTTMADATPGGTWTSSPAITASVTGGVVTGITAGTATISYTVSNACGDVTATKNITINPMPSISVIIGADGICVGATTAYTDGIPGGTWTSSTPAVATVSGTGSVHGVATGVATITYTTTNTWCTSRETKAITVSVVPVAGPISGPAEVCEGLTVLLTAPTPGGRWSSSDTTTVAIDSLTGVALGAWNGVVGITYTLTNGCASATATRLLNVGAVMEYHNVIATIAGNGVYGYAGDGGMATDAQITNIFGTTYDAAGNLYIVDDYNGVVRKIDPSGVITLFAGSPGITTTSFGDGGLAVGAGLWSPSGVACDAAGNVYIGEYQGRIRKVDAAGIITTFFYSPTVSLRELTIDAAGNIYATDDYSHVIIKIAPSGAYSTFAGNGTPGFSGDGGAATAAQLNGPQGVAADRFGNVYIADRSNYRVRKVNSLGIITTVGGTGTPGYSGDYGAATAENMMPSALAVDTNGNIYVAEYAMSIVRKINATNHLLTRVAGNGDPSYSGDGMIGMAAHIAPNSIAIDRNTGGLVIGEYGNSRVRKLVNFLAGTVSGPTAICMGGFTTFASTYSGGAWSSSNTAIATTNPFTGLVLPVSTGTVTITYSVVSDCDSTSVSQVLTVLPTADPGTITGLTDVCAGAGITLADAAPGGSWLSTNPSVASVGGTGVVTGIAAGTAVISYYVIDACGALAATTQTVTVNPLPDAGTISGAATVMCVDSVLTLTDPAAGGVWGSRVGNVTVTGGVVAGVTTGPDTVTYTVTNGCGVKTAEYRLTVNGCNVGVHNVHGTASGLELYPNPNPGRFSLMLTTATAVQADVVVRSVTGEQIRNFSMTTNKENDVVMNVAPGIYFVTATTTDRTYTVKLTVTE